MNEEEEEQDIYIQQKKKMSQDRMNECMIEARNERTNECMHARTTLHVDTPAPGCTGTHPWQQRETQVVYYPLL